MNIVVCVKQVPDTTAECKLKPSDSTLDRASVDGLINELDEYAIEEGLRIAETQHEAGAEAQVTILSMGPEPAAESIRTALSMGADRAVHLLDDALARSDALSTSYALAQVLRQTGFDLVICGPESYEESGRPWPHSGVVVSSAGRDAPREYPKRRAHASGAGIWRVARPDDLPRAVQGFVGLTG